MFLDASKNRLEQLPPEIDGCVSLADLHLSLNLLRSLPDTLGRLSSLTSLKVDENRLTHLPFSIGGLACDFSWFSAFILVQVASFFLQTGVVV